MQVKLLLAVVVLVGCWHKEPVSPPPPSTPSLLSDVGPAPRVYARISLGEPWVRRNLDAIVPALPALFGGKSFADCGLDLARLTTVRVAIGEPFRISGELDGEVDLAALTCLVGEDRMHRLAARGVTIKARAGGLAFSYKAQHVDEPDDMIASRCRDTSCAVGMFGPRDKPLWVELGIGGRIRWRISGVSLGDGAARIAAAVDALRASAPSLAALAIRAEQGALVIETPADLDAEALQPLLALIEAFKIPSTSMVPTLLFGDHIYAVKGTLVGELRPGDLIVHNHEGHSYVRRYIAGAGQTVQETKDGFLVDGRPLGREIVAADYAYDEPDVDNARTQHGTVVRERLGGRSYLTLDTVPPGDAGSWTVPAGHMFLLGDHRDNSNDSRFSGPFPVEELVGRVVTIWFAMRDGAPAWDRIGTAVE